MRLRGPECDANALRSDPLLKLVLGHLPDADHDLASQPTLSRLENAPGARECLRIAQALVELYVRERGKDGAPGRVLLDLDSPDDPTHSEQAGHAAARADKDRRQGASATQEDSLASGLGTPRSAPMAEASPAGSKRGRE